MNEKNIPPVLIEVIGSRRLPTQPSSLCTTIQNEPLRQELMERGFKQRDAEHITQAVCNDCDAFLTLDNGIRRNHRKEWLEAYLSLKIRRPSELLAELSA